MNTNPEMDQLRRQWRNQPGAPLDLASLHDQMKAESRAYGRSLLVAGLITALVLCVQLARALWHGTPATWFGVVWTALFSAVMWPVSLWLSRGTRHPRDESTAAYLDVSIRRCRAVLVGVPVGIVMYILGLASTLLVRHRLFGGDWSDALFSTPMIIAGWIGVPLYSAGMLWIASRQRRQLQVFEALKRELGEG
jgi:hypothetical protein